MPNINASKKGRIVGAVESTQAAARDTGGASAQEFTSNQTTAIQYFASSGRGGGTFRYIRSYFGFDTSGISSTLSSGVLNIAGSSTSQFNSADLIGVKSEAFGGDLGSTLVAGDFQPVFGTVYTNELSTWNISGGSNSFTLTSQALTDIVNNDVFIVCLVEKDSDFDDDGSMGDGSFAAGINFGGTNRLELVSAATGYGNQILAIDSSDIDEVIGIETNNIDEIIGV